MADSNSLYNVPQLAICIEPMNRLVGREYKFRIPALTPDAGGDTESTKTIRQTSSGLNSKSNLKVGNLAVSNCITIFVPPEVMAKYPSPEFSYTNSGTVRISSYGGITELLRALRDGGPLNFKGILQAKVTKSDQTIPKNSKWIVVFVGGDPSQPKVIAKYE